jgi:predicted nucleotidyltransferase
MEWMRKFVGFRVLEWFLVHPSEEVHLNEFARALEISPGSAKEYCDRLAEDGLIRERAMGNLRLFRLNREDFAAREILRAYHVLRLKDLGIDRIAEGCTSLAVYGSFASGNLDERSDLDLLVIGEESDVDRDRILELESALGREAQLTVIPFYRWEAMKNEGDRFAESVLRDHILITGVEL